MAIAHCSQRLTGSDDSAHLSRFVEILDWDHRPDDRRLSRFNAAVEQFSFESWTFRDARQGRSFWMTFTPKLRQKYKEWIVEDLGCPELYSRQLTRTICRMPEQPKPKNLVQ